MEKKRYRGVVFLDDVAQLPKDAKFGGVMSFCKEESLDKVNAKKAMDINRNVEQCTCCKDVIKLLEATSKVPGSNHNFTLYKTKVYSSREPKWCYFLLVEDFNLLL